MSRLLASKTMKQTLVAQEQLSLRVLGIQDSHTGDSLYGQLRKIMHSPSRRPAFAVQIVRSAFELSLRRARDETEQQMISDAREIAMAASVRQVASSTQNATIRSNRIARSVSPFCRLRNTRLYQVVILFCGFSRMCAFPLLRASAARMGSHARRLAQAHVPPAHSSLP